MSGRFHFYLTTYCPRRLNTFGYGRYLTWVSNEQAFKAKPTLSYAQWPPRQLLPKVDFEMDPLCLNSFGLLQERMYQWSN